MQKTPQRTITVVSLSESSTAKKTVSRNLPTDLPTLFSNLREILLSQSGNSEDIDSIASRYVDAITEKIRHFSSLPSTKETFDAVLTNMKTFINVLLSITIDLNDDVSQLFFHIYEALYEAQESIDFSEIYASHPSYARTVCHCCFDLLALPVIKDFLNDTYPAGLFSHVVCALQFILGHAETTIEPIVFKKNELQDQIPTIRLLLQFVDRNKRNLEQTDRGTIIDSILSYMWNLSDDTSLVPTLIEAKCADYAMQWLAMEDISMDIQRKCIHVIHNLARHEKGVKALTDGNCLTILKAFQQRILEPNKANDGELYRELRLVYCMAVSLLTEPKENREDLGSLRKILDQLMQLAVDAGQSESNKYGGFHVSETVVVLTKLCVHDQVLKYVLNESNVVGIEAENKVDFFCELLVKFRSALLGEDELDQLTLIALFNIVWSISFHDEYLDQLMANTKFIHTVKSFAMDEEIASVEQYVPNHMSSIQKAANGILWNLDIDNPARAARTAANPVSDESKQSDTNSSNRTRVMVSYCHADGDFCHQLVDGLRKENSLDVWVDFAFCHTDDFWEEIAEAIEKATVVLFLMSKDYQDSKSCRQEVMYAKDSLKKRFIPIYVKKEFTATGWLGVRIVGPQYIRFGKKSFEETVKELVKLVNDEKTPTESAPKEPTKPLPPVTESTTSPTTTTNEPALTTAHDTSMLKPSEDNHVESALKPPKKPVEQWNNKDIAQWFENNQVRRELVDIYDFKHGTDLLLYGQCLRPDWQIEYNDVKERFRTKYQSTLYRDQFVRFVGAVNRLKASTPASKSRTCTIS